MTNQRIRGRCPYGFRQVGNKCISYELTYEWKEYYDEPQKRKFQYRQEAIDYKNQIKSGYPKNKMLGIKKIVKNV